ncbi:MAG: chromosome segregation ATPase [Snowella sp.]|nr:chromosome segregation ATPase [Snowella sp.]
MTINSNNLLPSNPTPPTEPELLAIEPQGLHQRLFRQLQDTAERFPLQFWAIILILVSSGVGFGATALLLKLPKTPQCSRVFWPIASASMRLYCAQLSAEERTVDSLLRAIELVAFLPKDHPLYGEANRSIEEWADEILDLAEESYQAGKLDEAIKTAKRIPNNVQAYKLVEERIATWQETWKKGEEIYANVESNLRKAYWNDAFREAVKLLNLDNRYWATTKYDETIKNIQIAQEESKKLDVAFNIFRRGGIDNWIQAIAEASKVPSSSYAYEEGQRLIGKAKEKISEYVQQLIDDKDWQTLASTVERLPENIFPAEDLSEWQILASAGTDAQAGTLESLQSAITTAERIVDQNRPLYQTTQQLIAGWKTEVQDLTLLAQARQTAEAGTVDALNAAIAQAQQIPSSNARYRDARQDIANWTRQVQVTEDSPILNKAKELAASGNITDLKQAISQANLINRDRALYSEARQEIQGWRTTVETQEDQPILDQAIALANTQDYQSAISTASQIGSGRALHSQAQKNIRRWQSEIQSQRDLQRANSLAARRTPDSLVAAIRLVNRIPSSTEAGSQRTQSINNWSYQLLALAQEKASVSAYSEAIRLARLIPKDSSAYSTARDLMTDWKGLIAPPPTPVADPVSMPLPSSPDLDTPLSSP